MNAELRRPFVPEYVEVPGDTVLEVIQSLGISQSELAERTGRPKKTINEIINGKAAITPETALQLERVLGVPASFWNTAEQLYRATLARQNARDHLRADVDWLRQIPLKSLIDARWIIRHTDPVEQLDAVLTFFGVASVRAWNEVWGQLPKSVAYRRSTAIDADIASLAAWLRRGELAARLIHSRPFDAQAFRTTLTSIRALTKDASTAFIQPLVEACAAVGVAVCFVPELPKMGVCGATRWLTPDKALIQLSLRYKTNDQMWFTFFHEAGHILLHGKKELFVELAKPPGPAIAGAESAEELSRSEEEANRFAQELLIPSTLWERFTRAHDFSADAIRTFAAHIDLAPGVVLGRLQRERRLPFATTLNRTLKVRYRFATETS